MNTPPAIAIVLASMMILMHSCNAIPTTDSAYRQALQDLDRVMAQMDEYAQLNAFRTNSLKSKLQTEEDAKETYRIYDELFNEYDRYDVDSAMFYAHKKIDLAASLNDSLITCDAILDLASRYLTSGMYQTALEMMQTMSLPSNISDEDRARYYQSFHTLYHNLALTTHDPLIRKRYQDKELDYRQKSNEAMKEGMMNYYTIKATILIEQGQTESARKMMEELLSGPNRSPDDLAIIHYYIGKSYREEGNTDMALKHYAISSRYDFLGPFRASRSLVQTSRLLLRKNQIEKAYQYITRNYEDAIQADARLCLNEIADFMPEIITSYNQLEKKHFNQLVIILFVSVFLLLISILALAYVATLRNRLATANRSIKRMNSDLKQNVARLKEANDIKESYLGRYLSMFSTHISSLENYRSSLRVVSKSMDLRDIQQALKSDEFIDAERDSLYKEFDRTFLGIFPDFVKELNSLLQEDKRIGLDLPEGRLSNEIRIFALIRLGVKESGLIARFLKKSPSTIYNYRVKLRNAAICPNEEFETRLMEIGKA